MKSRSEWTQRKVGDFAKVISGYAFKSDEFQNAGIPVIKIKNIRKGYIDLSDVQYVDEKYLSIDEKYHVNSGDILISLTGSHLTQPDSVVGRVTLHNSSLGLCLLNQRAGKVIIKNTTMCDSRFLFYILGFEDNARVIALMAHGAANQANVSPTQVESLEIKLPSIFIQHKIASILSAYDDLIENNNRRINILEEMAQVIYREWFVNFRFPGHEKVKMVKSELGMIPEGWEIVKFKDLVDCIKDSTDAGEHLSDRLYVPIDCIPKRSLTLLEANPWEEAKSSLILFKKGDILFGAMRPYFHKVSIAPFDGVTRTTCFVLRPKTIELLAYSLMMAFQEETVNYANAHSQGATIPYAVWDGSLSEISVLLPRKDILIKFNELVLPMLQVFQTAYLKIQNLRKTRDLLLPKLIRGEIDVEGMDIQIGEGNE